MDQELGLIAKGVSRLFKAWTTPGKDHQPGLYQQLQMQLEHIQVERKSSWAGTPPKASTGRLQLRDYCEEISLQNATTP